MIRISVIILLFLISLSTVRAQDLLDLPDIAGGPDSVAAWKAYEMMHNEDPDSLSVIFSERDNREKLKGNVNLEYVHPFWSIIPAAKLTQYCRQHNIKCRSDSLHSTLMKLSTDISDFHRFFLENQIIPDLDLKNIPQLEYYGFLYGNYGKHNIYYGWDFDVSMCRMLDILYEKYWDEIWTDDKQLHFYVYKCMIFSEPGNSNGFNRYYMRFRNQPVELRNRLYNLYRVEEDYKLRQAFMISMYMLEKDLPETDRLNIRMPLKEYLDNISQTIAYTDYVLDFTEKDYPYFFKKINDAEDMHELQELFSLLERYGSYAATSYFIKLLDDRRLYAVVTGSARMRSGGCVPLRRETTVAEKALWYLQSIHQYPGVTGKRYNNSGIVIINHLFSSTDPNILKKQRKFWRRYWRKNKDNVANWKTIFKEQYLHHVVSNDTLTGSEIVQGLNRIDLNAEERALVLSQTVKLKYASAIDDIRFRDGEVLPKEILKTFAGVDIFYNDFTELVKHVDRSDDAYFLQHFLAKLQEFDEDDQGDIISDLMYYDWFKDFILKNQKDTMFISLVKDRFKLEVTGYNDSYSNFDDGGLFFIETLGFSTEQQLDYILNHDLSEREYVLKELCNSLEWHEWPAFLNRWKDLDIQRSWLQDRIFLEWMGVSIGGGDSILMGRLVKDMAKMNEMELKCHYLAENEMPVLTDEKKLDFSLIYKYLHYNYISDGFATRGNGGREEFVLPVIAVLKLHFRSEEDSTEFWISYLENNNLVDYRFKTTFLGNVEHGHINDTIFD